MSPFSHDVRFGPEFLLKVSKKPPFSRVVQSFAEVLASEMARLDHAEIPPSSAFAPPARSLEYGFMAVVGSAFLAPLAPVAVVVAPAPAPVPAVVVSVREPAVDRLLRRFREGHVEPEIAALPLQLFAE